VTRTSSPASSMAWMNCARVSRDTIGEGERGAGSGERVSGNEDG
jgi:hypothetical protein